MASKFFNKPQLSQSQLTQAEQTTETGVDNLANKQAAQVDRSIDMLTGIGRSALSVASAYTANVDAKHRLQSGEQTAKFSAQIRGKLSKMEDIDSMSDKQLEATYRDLSEDFLKEYKDEAYASQLRKDVGHMKKGVMDQLYIRRDNVHVKKVSEATSGKASDFAQQYSAGNMDDKAFQESIDVLMDESMIAHQAPIANSVGLEGERRSKYQTLTREQAKKAILQGIMVQTGEPDNSKVADILGSKGFRKSMGVNDADVEYNKVVELARRKGAQADKFNYDTKLDNLKEGLYSMTNVGLQVNIDDQVKSFRLKGHKLTAQDEHKLRRAFKSENKLITNFTDYRYNLKSYILTKDGKQIRKPSKDISVDWTPKQQQDVYNKSLAFDLKLNNSEHGLSIGNVAGALTTPQGQKAFKDYLQDGGKLPNSLINQFDIPSGSTVDKWDEANAALMAMEVASMGSGHSIGGLIGAKTVGKIRGFSRLLNDDTMDASTKENAIEAFQLQSTQLNPQGYLKGKDSEKLDPVWLKEKSMDNSFFSIGELQSATQNAYEIEHYYNSARLAGLSDSDAKDRAMDLFHENNVQMEMPTGEEIMLSRKHEYLNKEGIKAFSETFPNIKEQKDEIAFTGWYQKWLLDRETSIRKSYSFGMTGKYDITYEGNIMGSFTYKEYTEWLRNADHETREAVMDVEIKKQRSKEEDEKAFKKRKENMQKTKYTTESMDHIFNLKI